MATKRVKSEITVFLALLMIVMITFIAALIESSTISVAKSYARGEANRAIASAFAEYHQTTLEAFDIFVLEGTYETGNYSIDNVIDRLALYGNDIAKWDVVQVQLLTDSSGAAFEEQILLYMKEKYGLNQLESLGLDIELLETQRSEGEEVVGDYEDAIDELTAQIEGSELTLEELDLDGVLDFQGMSILDLVVKDASELSNAQINLDTLPSNRTLQQGISSYQIENSNEALAGVMVRNYLLEHYYCKTDEENSQGLVYEVEYLLEGKDSDKENLESVVNKLIWMRIGVNYACIYQSVSMKAEVSAMALSIATAAAVPVLQPAIEQALILGWAYGETIMDIRSLLSGKRVPLVKTQADWQLGLSGLMTLGSTEDSYESKDVEGGISYEEYLSILLYLEDKEVLLMRGLDMLEQRMQYTEGLTYFKVDQCITSLEFTNTATVVGGFTYEFPVSYTYR